MACLSSQREGELLLAAALRVSSWKAASNSLGPMERRPFEVESNRRFSLRLSESLWNVSEFQVFDLQGTFFGSQMMQGGPQAMR